ncbi:uncharacterized protein LOC132257735 [Phlebotomus argentipes]|uniref:uncharacterized protein LOC132257735 n=1 Tax=Phlebotomus argentipes TaxID=94469 RepID=UPI002892F309|nr:uncharacterized protein LOC132257735 [Phlebotomus argentipes]
MLTCVCRPVTSSLPKPSTMAPQKRSPIVVTAEPRFATATIVKKSKTSKKVPGRPTAAELRAMALRQQQQIDSQHQLLAAKEQRLRFLKAQEARGAAAAAEGERLRRLRERVEAQESKLRRLRALRGQVDLQKTYNVTLSNDLDSIRALFSEKEKELSLAVAKVEALTRQLEDLRRDRRGPLNLIPGGAPGGNQQQSAAARELDKLRRELMYRNQLSLQQDARLHLQREALQQRQAELRSVDQRILELQSRLQRKKASNLLLQAAQHPSPSPPQLTPPAATQPLQNGTTATVRPSSNVYPSQRVAPRANNVAAVEPYVHTPQKSAAPITKPAHHLIHDLAALKQMSQNSSQASIVNHVAYAESDESKLARQKRQLAAKMKDADEDLTVTDFAAKKNDPKYQTLPYNTKFGTPFGAKTPSSAPSAVSAAAATTTTTTVTSNGSVSKTNECDSEKAGEMAKSVQKKEDKPTPKPKSLHQIPSGNLVVPPRKPISSVAPTTMIPKIVAHNPKVQMVAPSVNHASGIPVSVASEADKVRPALPPKPNKSPPQSDTDSPSTSAAATSPTTSAPTIVSMINKPPVTEPASSSSDSSSPVLPPPMGLSDNLPIKPKPLTIKKQPIHEQPKLRSSSGIKPVQYTSRRIEMPPAFLFPEVATAELKDKSDPPQSSPPVAPPKPSPEEPATPNGSLDETDKSTGSSADDTVTSSESDIVPRRTRSISSGEGGGKAKLARRVSFDPLALLLDASLEGELELVRKTAMQVTNPSAANDEGITALHNAICAGHLEIVKFLVEYGCDVNAQDSDGWTPLHCAASCNNLAMVKFLVESGACLFAATLSDHETPAEKCEEDEEGFDGCSEYLYSIQEKLGILNSGEVSAVFSYDAQQADELTFCINDRLTILRKGDDAEREWWWAKDSTGKEGYVPRNLLGLYPRISTRHSPNLEYLRPSEDIGECTYTAQWTMEMDTDSECSQNSTESRNTSASSTTGRSEESVDDVGEPLEAATIAKQRLNLPKGLCESKSIFNEFFSDKMWNTLTNDMRTYLVDNFLPKFPGNDEHEKDITLQMIFNRETFRFGSSPLVDFQRNLEEGNYRPDIVKYRNSILRSQRREQRYQECERISRIAKASVMSRERLLRLAYDSPPGASLKRAAESANHVAKAVNVAAAVRAKKRFYQEISSTAKEMGIPLSDDEGFPDMGASAAPSIARKKRNLALNPGPTSPCAEVKIISTFTQRFASAENPGVPLNVVPPTEDSYRTMLYQHKKRKLREAEHPELDVSEVKLKDIYARTQLSVGYRRLTPNSGKVTLGAKKSALAKLKQDIAAAPIPSIQIQTTGNVTKPPQQPQTTSTLYKSPSLLMTAKSEEDPLVKIEPELYLSPTPSSESAVKIPGVERKKLVVKKRANSVSPSGASGVKKKVTAANGSIVPTNSMIHVKLEEEEEEDDVDIRDIIKIEETQVGEDSPGNHSQVFDKVKPATFSDLEGIDMMHLPVDLDASDHIDILNDITDEANCSPELMQETHACFLSLIRDIFCATPDHRMAMDNLQRKIATWLGNPITPLNDWFSLCDNWLTQLPSVIHFLAGEFVDQPEDYVPYLEYKVNLDIYQWIGAGRDTDQHLIPLCAYWLSRKHEMGTRPNPPKLEKTRSSSFSDGEEFSSGLMPPEKPVSPPPPRCPTAWTVQKASEDEIEEFRRQERHRFDNPHMAFTYRMHGYESVVGPVKGIYTQVPGVSKARLHNMLTRDRPNFVTILTLVRDATARLPNGEGTRADICELLKSSQYLNPSAQDNVLQTIVSGALDRMHTEHDPCVRFDSKRKIWIYLHRDRSEDEFDRLHQQQQGMSKPKKVPSRTKLKPSSRIVSGKSPPTNSHVNVLKSISTGGVMAQTSVVVAAGKIIKSPQKLSGLPSIVGKSQQLPALSTIQSNTTNQLPVVQTPPPLLNKISPHRSVVKAELVPIKSIPPLATEKNQIEHIDVEASLEAHTTPVLINKSLQSVPGLVQKASLGAPSPTTSVKVSTSSGIQTVHVSVATTTHGSASSRPLTSLLANSATHSVLVNQQNRSQSPNVAARVKKAPGKPPILIQSPSKGAPPLLTQSSASGQSYIIPFNLTNASGEPTLAKVISSLPATSASGVNPKLVKSSIPPALTSTASSSLLGKNAIRVATTIGTKSLINPAVISLHQQKTPTVVSTAGKTPTLQQKSGLSVVSGIVTPPGSIVKSQQQLTTTQQKQILQNIIAQQQQQKRLVQNAVVVSGSGSQATQQQLKSIIVAANQAQSGPGSIVKIVTSTVPVTTGTNTSTMPGSSLINPQIIQIQQTGGAANGAKMQTVTTSNLTPQQQQNLFNTLRQQQLKSQNLQQSSTAGRQQSLIIKQHPMLQIQQKVPTTQTSQVSAGDKSVPVVTTASTTLVSAAVTQTIARKPTTVATVRPAASGASPLKVLTNQSGQLISLESLLQKQGIGGPIRVAGAKAGQTNLIQLAGAPGSHIAQYAVVSPARNIISVATPQRVVAAPVTTTASQGRVKVATATAASEGGQKLLAQKATATATSAGKAVAPAQAMVNAKLLGVQNIAAGKVKPGIRMVNASNLNIAHIGGKPVIIASKSAAPGQSGQTQGVILQSSAGTNGANLVIGGQTLKVQSNSLNLISPTSSNAQTVMIGNQFVKVQGQQQSQSSADSSANNSVSASGSAAVASAGSPVGKIVATSSQASPQASVKVQTPVQVTTQQQSPQMIIGAQVKKGNLVKGPGAGSPGQQRVVLALQSGGQILLPPGFQGGPINLKTLQGLKMISIPQQQQQQQQPQTAQPQQSPQATQAKGKTG